MGITGDLLGKHLLKHHLLPRSADVPTRQRYVKLVEGVRDNGGTVKIFSSLHLSGERECDRHLHVMTLYHVYYCRAWSVIGCCSNIEIPPSRA